MPFSYLKQYIDKLQLRGENDLADSIIKTTGSFSKEHLNTFCYNSHDTGLLFGNVQAGKTSQVFGIICAAADASFPIFLILTTDNVTLQQQTYNRVVRDLSCCGFCICGETDKQMFLDNALEKPAIIVLKKNSKVLLQWYNTLKSSSFVVGNALFIVDDEADAASPNTLVNYDEVSTVNSRLMKIRDASIASIYLQVTGTPQALLLQSSISDFKPSFTCYFEPGKGYLGGEFFFGSCNKSINYIDSFEEGIKDGLYYALVHHLIASAHLFLSGEKVCNFVIHPGVKKISHRSAEVSVMNKLRYIISEINSTEIVTDFQKEYYKSQPIKYSIHSFGDVMDRVKDLLLKQGVNVLVMNGDTAITDAEYNNGSNIIIGGNVLGRGVTFAKLQTLYYTRTAKKPQADTMWQHSRMFGYDRDPGLMSIYITKQLYKLFSDINSGNNSIINQVVRGIDKIQIFYPEGLTPTRKNVIDIKMVNMITGGTNYYPNDPENDDIDVLNTLLKEFDSAGYYQVGAKTVLEVLNHIIASEDFDLGAFKKIINARLASMPTEQAVLIVRRNREVTQGTGSLLSPNDREFGEKFGNKIVLTLYQIAGQHGWKQKNLWVPNIRLPDFINYYNVT